MLQMPLIQAVLTIVPALTYPQDFTVDSTGITTWSRTDVAQPTPQQIQTAYDARVAAQATNTQQATTLRQTVLAQAQSAVGVSVTVLTAVQVRALLTLMLWERGGITPDGKIAPLDWANR